jgi:uncharacterized membrane protein YbhN (UPF0104 family)
MYGAMASTGSPASRQARIRHLLASTWLRLAVSLLLLGILLTNIHPDDFVPAHQSAGTFAFLVSGFTLMAFSFVLAAWRWQRILAVFDAPIRLRTLVKHYLAGQFVGNVLPSTVGGDVLRIARSSRDTGARDVAFAAVVLERLTGFVALPLLTLIGFIVRPSLLEVRRTSLALVIATATILALVLLLFLAGHPRAAGRFRNHDNWMRSIGAIHVGVDRLRRDPTDAAMALFAAFAYQFCVVSAVYCAVHVVGLRIPNAAVLVVVPAVAMAQVVPITIGGLGVREGLLAFLWHPLGVPTGRAVAVGLLWYAMTLVVSIAGAPAFAIGHHRHHHTEDRPAGDKDSDVEAAAAGGSPGAA